MNLEGRSFEIALAALPMEGHSENSPGFDSNGRNVEDDCGGVQRPIEIFKPSKEYAVAMEGDDYSAGGGKSRTPLQSLKLNSELASPLSPFHLRDGSAKLFQPAQNSPRDGARISPLFKVPASPEGMNESAKRLQDDEVKEAAEEDNDQPRVYISQKAQRTPTVQPEEVPLILTHEAEAQTELMGAKRRHEETANAEIVTSALEAMASGSSKASRIVSSARKSRDFTGRAGRALRPDGEGVAGGDPSPRSARAHYRRVTPLGWFPRAKKTESYLERKIRMLQKEGGKLASLDETLGASNLHLSRVEREKRAAAASAKEASAARKASLVEASWCRILKAAGIPYMSAALELQKAEKKAAEALAAAAALGVVLGNGSSPRSPRLVSETDAASGASHNISAALETAFDVDKEVAAALKTALLRHTRDLKDAELRTAMILITEQQVLEASGGAQPDWVDHASEAAQEESIHVPVEGAMDLSPNRAASVDGASQDNPLVDAMLTRVKSLQPEQCTSLATIVATRGLNALLQEENLEQELDAKTEGSGGLGDVLVKHVSRLEAERAAALAAARAAAGEGGPKRRLSVVVNPVPDLGSICVKHVSRLEREKRAAIEAAAKEGEIRMSETASSSHLPDRQIEEGLDKGFVKRMSRLEKEKAAALERAEHLFGSGETRVSPRRSSRRVSLSRKLGLGESLIKHKSRLEREVEAARARRMSIAGKPLKEPAANQPSPPKKSRNFSFNNAPVASLGDVLVKHKSRLEKEKEAAKLAAQAVHETRAVQNAETRFSSANCETVLDVTAGSQSAQTEVKDTRDYASVPHAVHSGLAGMGVRKLSKLEMEKQAAAAAASSDGDPNNPWARRRPSFKARAESADLWAGVSLGAALKRHVSKLEQEQAAWRNAEEEAGNIGACVH